MKRKTLRRGISIKKEEVRRDAFTVRNEALNIMANIRQQEDVGTLWKYVRKTALCSAIRPREESGTWWI